jgi:WD40-like Beta Propeller Repeat
VEAGSPCRRVYGNHVRAGFWLAASALALSGCLSSDVTLSVRPDGSGTIRQALTSRPSAMAELDAVIPPDPGARPRPRGLDPSAEPPGQWATGSAPEMAALKHVFRDARIRLAVEPATPILATNSPHRSDTDVVLFEMDAQTALFSRQIDMLRATPASFDELLLMLGAVPGVTLAPAHVITVDFRGPENQTPASPQAPPDTDIYLAPLSSEAGRLTLGTPVNITNSPGYDNQPSFTPDGASVLFTSARGSSRPPAEPGVSPAAAPTDIYRYDIPAQRIVRVTNTPESEYSPGVTPDGKRIAVVRVEAGGTQRLWSFASDGTDPRVVLSDVKPVGYYAWVDDTTVALFILGQDGKPPTLQVADVSTGKATLVAERIGRSIQRMPSGPISFVQQADPGSAGPAVIKQLFNARLADRGSMGVAVVVPAVAGSTDPQLAWMPDGTVLAASGGTLYRWKSGEPAWSAVADLAALGLANVSRLAVSLKGDRIALVNQAR